MSETLSKPLPSLRRTREWKQKGAPSQLPLLPDEELIASLQQETGFSRLTLQTCVQRQLTSAKAIKSFLSPRLEDLTHPWTIRDMDKAIDRLVLTRERREPLLIFADYDVDGTTGAALLTWFLRDLEMVFEVRQPDRFRDGYGLNVAAVQEAFQKGTKVLITVDCGISSFEAAQKAKELGIDLIIIDHHQIDPEKGLPTALAVVNPQRSDCLSGLKQLCGCGLAFYTALALRARGRELGWFQSKKEPALKQHLDLVVMATAADLVPLTGDNHILVRFGFQVLKQSEKAGVKALLQTSGLSSQESLSPSYLGFVIGPRINASGRMQSASLAYELLTTENPKRAEELAQTLEELNQQRASTQNQIWDQVRTQVESQIQQGKFQHAIVIGDFHWHEGVVGIVASRVTEFFHRPAIILSFHENRAKGSARTFAGKDLLEGLRKCSSLLLGFGGHRHAAGLSLALEQVEAFAEEFNEAMEGSPTEAQGEAIWVEGDCTLDELTPACLQELEALGPFGPGNPEPIFCLGAQVKSYRILKERHLKLSLINPQQKPAWEAIWFHAAEHPDVLSEFSQPLSTQPEYRWAIVPELNRFRGKVTPTLRVRDWKKTLALILVWSFFYFPPTWAQNPSEAPSKKTIRTFLMNQRKEHLALLHQLKLEKKEWKEAQKIHQKEWEAQEKAARTLFFKQNKQGAERRTYIQAFLKRREELKTRLKEEEKEWTHRLEEAVQTLKKDQILRYQEFLKKPL